MVLSASAYTSLQYYGSVWTIFERQLLWMGLGVIAFVGTVRIRYDRWRRVRVVLPLRDARRCSWRCSCPASASSPGDRAGGSASGPLRIQPSELMKLAMAVFAADLLARRADRLEKPSAVVVPLLGLLAVSGLLVLEAARHGDGHGARLHHLRHALRRRRPAAARA